MSLVLTRRVEEKIILKSRRTAEEIVVIVTRIQPGSVRLAIDADKGGWDIYRSELIDGSRK